MTASNCNLHTAFSCIFCRNPTFTAENSHIAISNTARQLRVQTHTTEPIFQGESVVHIARASAQTYTEKRSYFAATGSLRQRRAVSSVRRHSDHSTRLTHLYLVTVEGGRAVHSRRQSSNQHHSLSLAQSLRQSRSLVRLNLHNTHTHTKAAGVVYYRCSRLSFRVASVPQQPSIMEAPSLLVERVQ